MGQEETGLSGVACCLCVLCRVQVCRMEHWRIRFSLQVHTSAMGVFHPANDGVWSPPYRMLTSQKSQIIVLSWQSCHGFELLTAQLSFFLGCIIFLLSFCVADRGLSNLHQVQTDGPIPPQNTVHFQTTTRISVQYNIIQYYIYDKKMFDRISYFHRPHYTFRRTIDPVRKFIICLSWIGNTVNLSLCRNFPYLWNWYIWQIQDRLTNTICMLMPTVQFRSTVSD